MRKIIGFFTDSYRDQPLDLLRKAQTLTILSLIFLVLIAVFMMVFFLSTGTLTQDARLLLFLVAGLMVILALIRSGTAVDGGLFVYRNGVRYFQPAGVPQHRKGYP
jgi:predicted membrane channel-forming protein YqfA (hemolysin III family)